MTHFPPYGPCKILQENSSHVLLLLPSGTKICTSKNNLRPELPFTGSTKKQQPCKSN